MVEVYPTFVNLETSFHRWRETKNSLIRNHQKDMLVGCLTLFSLFYQEQCWHHPALWQVSPQYSGKCNYENHLRKKSLNMPKWFL